MPEAETELATRLAALVSATPWLMDALLLVRDWAPEGAAIGAGSVRNLVWNELHGYARLPTPESDVDVVYFDANNLNRLRDQQLQSRLAALAPQYEWEVTNQAGVHLWFEQVFGYPVAPLFTLEAAIASWPETATAVAVRLEADHSLTVLAPLGLVDLFGLVVRFNRASASAESYLRRQQEKAYPTRWPNLTMLPP